MKKYDSNSSRREFLQMMGIIGVGATMFGIESCVNNSGVEKLRLYATGTLDIGDNWSVLKKSMNIELIFKDNGNDVGPVLSEMITGSAAEDYDLGGLQGGAEKELAEAGKIIPWDLNKIPNWKEVWPMVQEIPYTKDEKGNQIGLPIVINADSIIYLPEFTGENIDSYAYVFDPKFKGRSSMEDAWINSVIFTAIYLKESGLLKIENPGDLSEDELRGVMDFLMKKKREKQFLTFWKGWEQGLQLIKSKEVWIMTGWEPIVYAANKAGVNAKYAVPKEGYECWSNDLILHVGAKSRNVIDLAHEFANWELGGYYGCALSQMRGYVVPNFKNVEFAKKNPNELISNEAIDSTKQLEIVKHVEGKFPKSTGKFYWQNVRPKNYKLYEQLWSDLNNS